MSTLIWQRIDECTERTRVPGGWLVRVVNYTWTGDGYEDHVQSICYVPDHDNTWRL